MSNLDLLLANIEQTESLNQAQKDWHPTRTGSIDIRISKDGTWFHEGRPFQRTALVKLFASVLRREGDTHYLVTPAEKLAIQVDDAPFVATTMQTFKHDNEQAIAFTTTLGDSIIADRNHPIRVDIDQNSQQPKPYIHFRDDLDALISRSAFFDLANMAQEVKRGGHVYLTVHSMGIEFTLGCYSD
jgi:hypothetical protein